MWERYKKKEKCNNAGYNFHQYQIGAMLPDLLRKNYDKNNIILNIASKNHGILHCVLCVRLENFRVCNMQ